MNLKMRRGTANLRARFRGRHSTAGGSAPCRAAPPRRKSGVCAAREPGRLELESLAKSSSPASTDIMSAGVAGGTGVSA